MEFFKNRQKVIIESIKGINKPGRITLPPIIASSKDAKMATKHLANAEKKYKDIVKKIENILIDPSKNDNVYKALSKIFDFDSKFNLKRPDKTRYIIRRLARNRFFLGYPPRKNSDTSIGDAINWEWIIHCASALSRNNNVIIVSRDGDYGIQYMDKPVINDWLRREFRERVSQQSEIILTNKLTTALKKLDEHVSAEDVAAEDKIIKEDSSFSKENGPYKDVSINLLFKSFFDRLRNIEDTGVGMSEAEGGHIEPEGDPAEENTEDGSDGDISGTE